MICPTLNHIKPTWSVIGSGSLPGEREVQTQQAAAGEMILEEPTIFTEITKLDVRLRCMGTKLLYNLYIHLCKMFHEDCDE